MTVESGIGWAAPLRRLRFDRSKPQSCWPAELLAPGIRSQLQTVLGLGFADRISFGSCGDPKLRNSLLQTSRSRYLLPTGSVWLGLLGKEKIDD